MTAAAGEAAEASQTGRTRAVWATAASATTATRSRARPSSVRRTWRMRWYASPRYSSTSQRLFCCFFGLNLKIALRCKSGVSVQTHPATARTQTDKRTKCLVFSFGGVEEGRTARSGWLSPTRNPAGFKEGGFFSWFTRQLHKTSQSSCSQVSPQLPRIGSREMKHPLKYRTVSVHIRWAKRRIWWWCCDVRTGRGLRGLHLPCRFWPSLVCCLSMLLSRHQLFLSLQFTSTWFFIWHSLSTVWCCTEDAVSSQVCNSMTKSFRISNSVSSILWLIHSVLQHILLSDTSWRSLDTSPVTVQRKSIPVEQSSKLCACSSSSKSLLNRKCTLTHAVWPCVKRVRCDRPCSLEWKS